jgi:type IV secretion system protein VirD4
MAKHRAVRIAVALALFAAGAALSVYLAGAIDAITAAHSPSGASGLTYAEAFSGILAGGSARSMYLLLCAACALASLALYLSFDSGYETGQMKVASNIWIPKPAGQGQYGNAKFLAAKEIDGRLGSYILHRDGSTEPPTLTGCGLVVGKKGLKGGSEKVYYVPGDVHCLIDGVTGAGKSRRMVIETVVTAAWAGHSQFIIDPKGELYDYTNKAVREAGSEVYVLDYKNPEKSNRNNPLQVVIDACKAGNDNVAERAAWDLTSTLVGEKSAYGEPIWHNGEMSVVAAGILCVVYGAPEGCKNLANVYWFLAEMCKPVDKKVPIVKYVEQLPESHPARGLLAIAEISPDKMQGSFYGSALTTLSLFIARDIYAVTRASDFGLADLGRRQTAFYVILPDQKTTYYPIASVFFSQLYEQLVELADSCGGRLPVKVDFQNDEFGNFLKVPDLVPKMTAARSRGIRLNLFLQGYDMLDDKYGREQANIVRGQCTAWAHLKTGDEGTLGALSKKLDTYTTTSASKTLPKATAGSGSENVSLIKRELLTPGEVGMIGAPDLLLILDGKPMMMFAPDLSKWNFNRLLGMGSEEENARLRRESFAARRGTADVSEDVKLWGIWTNYRDMLLREKKEAVLAAAAAAAREKERKEREQYERYTFEDNFN